MGRKAAPPPADPLDAWVQTWGGEMTVADGQVHMFDEKAGLNYSLPLEPRETLAERLKEALSEAKAPANQGKGA